MKPLLLALAASCAHEYWPECKHVTGRAPAAQVVRTGGSARVVKDPQRLWFRHRVIEDAPGSVDERVDEQRFAVFPTLKACQ